MSEARSLTPLSESDYDAIADAVMETARGRWFMTEFARRNRQADTTQLLTAIGRIERIVGEGPQPSQAMPDLAEVVALIGDLRRDLERISGRGDQPSSGLAMRIEGAAGQIAVAVEGVQDCAWSLREANAEQEVCDRLDRHARDIHAASAGIEATAQQIGKIADTIAMLDSSLRAFTAMAQAPAGAVVEASFPVFPDRERPDTAARDVVHPIRPGIYDDIDIVEIDDVAASTLPEHGPPREQIPLPGRSTMDVKLGTIQLLSDDIMFAEDGADLPAPPAATSEADLRLLDVLPADRKLAYFA